MELESGSLVAVLLAVLEHPVFVLLCGALSTAYLVPVLMHRATVRQSRLEKALTLIERGATTSQHINTLLTTLELFHKDRSGESGVHLDLRAEQANVREKMVDLYLSFDRNAWGWYWDIRTYAELLELDAGEVKRTDELAREYEEALIQTTNAINDLWTQLLRNDYDPSNKAHLLAMEETRATVSVLEGKRRDSLSRIAAIISPAFLARRSIAS